MKKIYIISAFLLLFILFLSVDCYASEVVESLRVEYEGQYYDIPLPEVTQQRNYTSVYQRFGTDELILFYGNSQLTYTQQCTKHYSTLGVDCLTCDITVYGYNYCNITNFTGWEYVNTQNNDFHLYGVLQPNEGYKYKMIYTNADIADSNGNVFFQPPPAVLEEITLAEIMKTAGEQATEETEKIILIVITITAGLTVLLIGLKKGLTVLMNGLRH